MNFQKWYIEVIEWNIIVLFKNMLLEKLDTHMQKHLNLDPVSYTP